MKPAPFEYVVANSVSDAIHALQKYGADSCIIAGGQSLLQEMNMRQAKPSYIVDINGITDLDYVRLTSDSLAIGALTRIARLNVPSLWHHIALFYGKPLSISPIFRFAVAGRSAVALCKTPRVPNTESLPVCSTLRWSSQDRKANASSRHPAFFSKPFHHHCQAG